jgi:acetylglutamate kinase
LKQLFVIKIGGNIIDEKAKLLSFLSSFARVNEPKILVHGGGKLATTMAAQLNIPQQLVDGRRITDEATLKIVTMVYAGLINKKLVSILQANHCHAMGFSGADGNLILAHKRIHSTIDYGFAGDIDRINTPLLEEMLRMGLTPVIAPITHDGHGQLLNTNADSIAQEIAKACSALYEVSLIYSFEKNGVLQDVQDDSSVISSIRPSSYEQLKAEKKIFAGMIPKIDNAFTALNGGVRRVIIGKAEQLEELITNKAGTTISNENT